MSGGGQPKQRWALRVAVSEYIYSCLVSKETDPDAIIAGFKRYAPDAWQEPIVANFAYRRELLDGALMRCVSTKWDYEEIEPLLKAVMLEALAEQHAHKTPRGVLIKEALTTLQRHADPALKKLAHAVLDKALLSDPEEE